LTEMVLIMQLPILLHKYTQQAALFFHEKQKGGINSAFLHEHFYMISTFLRLEIHYEKIRGNRFQKAIIDP
jgi:hypothetical protein